MHYQKVEIPQSLLDQLKEEVDRRREKLKKGKGAIACPTMEVIAKMYGLSVSGNHNDNWWNRTIDYLDRDYPDWRGYTIDYHKK